MGQQLRADLDIPRRSGQGWKITATSKFDFTASHALPNRAISGNDCSNINSLGNKTSCVSNQ
jgi:hypothetical protein